MFVPTKTKSIYPVSLNEAKNFLRIDDSWNRDDGLITSLIMAATQYCEDYIGKDIAETENSLKIYDFCNNYIGLHEGNYLETTSVLAADNSTNITVDRTEIHINYAVIYLVDHQSQDPIYVNYKTGYADSVAPEVIKIAILIKIGNLYDMERNSYTNIKYNDNTINRLLDSYKLIRF
jgi:uncharacterized phage protein (predicted DNA packaging)